MTITPKKKDPYITYFLMDFQDDYDYIIGMFRGSKKYKMKDFSNKKVLVTGGLGFMEATSL